MTPAELDFARGAIRAVRESATGRGIAGPAALRLADAADVLIEDNERMRALLILFRATVLANREWALAHGIAKEQARALLPEGLTTTRMYMVGSFRSWIHYLQQRLHPSTQAEHRPRRAARHRQDPQARAAPRRQRDALQDREMNSLIEAARAFPPKEIE